MNKSLLLSLALFCCGLQIQAQTLNEPKVTVSRNEILNRYEEAISLMHRDKGQYAKARAILEEIMPYADDMVREYALPKIPLSWYFEGAECHLAKKYDEALVC